MTTMEINNFDGEYRFLSNFWPCVIEYNGVTFPSTEAAFQAAKAIKYEDFCSFKHMSPGQSKRAGRTLVMRDDWEFIKIGVMKFLVTQKFTVHQSLKEKLLATGDADLIEGNTWNDTFWGVCKGKGQNHLGYILMGVRRKLREENNY